jgi:uncharacterized protein (TIGR03437 family)
LWVQDTQINTIAPWSLVPGQTTEICVMTAGTKTNCLTQPATETSPGVFSVDGSHAAALNQDGTINSALNPAAPGSIVSIFATGLGPISPAQADGTLVGFPLPMNVLPVNVEAGVPGHTTNFEITYSGPAPMLVSGASQINFRVQHVLNQICVSVPSGQQDCFLVAVN